MRRWGNCLWVVVVFGLLAADPFGGMEQASAAAHTAKLPLVDWNCISPGRVKPAQIVLACGDGNAMAEYLTWAKWDDRSATATGSLKQNDCNPDCANGSFHTYPARFTLSETVPVAGRNYFTRVTIRFAQKGPSARRSEMVKDCFDTPPARYIPRCPADLQRSG